MADIVEQLRFGSKVALALHKGGHRQPEAWEIMIDAAREIERLREEIAILKDRYQALEQAMRVNDEHIDKLLSQGGL